MPEPSSATSARPVQRPASDGARSSRATISTARARNPDPTATACNRRRVTPLECRALLRKRTAAYSSNPKKYATIRTVSQPGSGCSIATSTITVAARPTSARRSTALGTPTKSSRRRNRRYGRAMPSAAPTALVTPFGGIPRTCRTQVKAMLPAAAPKSKAVSTFARSGRRTAPTTAAQNTPTNRACVSHCRS